MEYRKFGRTGLKVSAISLGTMAFGRWIDEEASAVILDQALDQGINLVDTANVYGAGESERILGRLLKERRHDIVLATKVHGRVGEGVNDGGQSRYHIFKAVEDSLKRLNTDYLDLYQVHRFDPHTPLEETLRALDDLVRQGKVRYIGASNFAAWQLAKAHGVSALHGLERFESLQPEYSLISREIEQEIIPFVQSEQVAVIVYSPLGRGILSGKYRAGEAAPKDSRLAAGEQRLEQLLEKNALAVAEAIKPLAEERGLTPAQFALSWVLSRPGITSAILGASKPHHIAEAAASWDVRLTESELTQVDEALSKLAQGKISVLH
ncbi:aryl-alcohol dehydrogenase-like predicted oxidoreductase [Paenibacillus phyllosphaerae]|uniref:Aryl-alcohol dehydrogenase-like predicted oxidoreductase n=1 Tax=Paenibacillus phyllosphaerae TaxID=274593 RepID=A0A7W5AZ56_9BACL|nr:aldo/keto reductase [Paenibacillus phyllosphaerae]MBB3111413.1 aryl-alcohol dehydrogenase-like predicted oxidoreductase [Paenibacillus phyllosphaerae]